MKKMMRCRVCGAYTLKKIHCGKETKSAHPPKYAHIKGVSNERNHNFGEEEEKT